MVAIPIQKLGENPVLSNYFSKCKWFAIIDRGVISFEKNIYDNGCLIVDWLNKLGVSKTVLNKIGHHPLDKMLELDISCYYDENKKDNLLQVLEKLVDKKLIKIDSSNKDNIIDFVNGCKDIC